MRLNLKCQCSSGAFFVKTCAFSPAGDKWDNEGFSALVAMVNHAEIISLLFSLLSIFTSKFPLVP